MRERPTPPKSRRHVWWHTNCQSSNTSDCQWVGSIRLSTADGIIDFKKIYKGTVLNDLNLLSVELDCSTLPKTERFYTLANWLRLGQLRQFPYRFSSSLFCYWQVDRWQSDRANSLTIERVPPFFQSPFPKKSPLAFFGVREGGRFGFIPPIFNYVGNLRG